jgi:beta-glucosidase-like glycosyl hydrolase
MCANQELLNDQIRGNWSRPDTLIVTDCGAVTNMVPHGNGHGGAAASNNKYKTLVEATAAAINSGVDLETGTQEEEIHARDIQEKTSRPGVLVIRFHNQTCRAFAQTSSGQACTQRTRGKLTRAWFSCLLAGTARRPCVDRRQHYRC